MFMMVVLFRVYTAYHLFPYLLLLGGGMCASSNTHGGGSSRLLCWSKEWYSNAAHTVQLYIYSSVQFGYFPPVLPVKSSVCFFSSFFIFGLWALVSLIVDEGLRILFIIILNVLGFLCFTNAGAIT